MAVVVEGPGWVDHSGQPIAGRYPLGAERYLNAAAATYVPAVTTQTTIARYMALHGLVAVESAQRGLDQVEQRTLVRRAEVAYAMICLAHRRSAEHGDDEPLPHGVLGLNRLLGRRGEIDLDEGMRSYGQSSYGYWYQYSGSEQALGVTDIANGYAPGRYLQEPAVVSRLAPVLDLAQSSTPLTLDSVESYAPLCLCRSSESPDGEWLARLFTGAVAEPGASHTLTRGILELFAAAMRQGPVGGVEQLDDFVLYHPSVAGESETAELWQVWRGLRFRAQSVRAWLHLWAHMLKTLGDIGGALALSDLADVVADRVDTGTVGEFLAGLPPIADGTGNPLAAEREVMERSLPTRWIAVLALGALRYRAMPEYRSRQRLGFVGEARTRSPREELSPYWVNVALDTWRSRSLREFARHLVYVMVRRAHRLTIRKSYVRNGRLVLPMRIRLQNDQVIKLANDRGWLPTMRWPALLEIGRQLGIFVKADDGAWKVGPHGGYLD